MGLKVKFEDLARPGLAIPANTKMVWIESPTNPTLKEINIVKVVQATRAASPNALVVVDNTFATPYNQRPLEFGADIVVHSATKYLNGHRGGAHMHP